MANGKRYFRPKAKELVGTPYDSRLEKRLHEGALKDAEFHPRNYVSYVVHHNYTPDFVITKDDGIELVCDAKGFPQDNQELQKLKAISNQLKDHQIFCVILEKEGKVLHWRSKRKDGTKMSFEDWLTKNKIMWVYEREAQNLTK